LAALCAVHGWPGGGSEPIFPDSPRFALNGALLLDLVRHRAFGAPVAYARQYYARLPAISIPYHPPLFPAFEAVLYAIFGVSDFTARLTVALTVALACLLLFRLVCLTHGSRAFAACVVVAFCAMPGSQWLASEVMLEFPSLVLVLASLMWLYRAGGESRRWWPWLWFAIFGIAAVWTKQQAVFLAGTPFLYIALQGRWRELARKRVWISVAILVAGSAAFYAVSRAANSESSVAWDQKTPEGIFSLAGYIWLRLAAYSRGYVETGAVPAVVFAFALAAYFPLRRRIEAFAKCDLYVAVILSSVGLLALMPFVETRYLFYTLPAVSVLACTLVREIGRLVFSSKYAWTAPAALALLSLGLYHRAPDRMTGPSRAAQFVLGAKTRRVLYCGRFNGDFIFDVRASEPDTGLAVVRGDKLAGIVRAPDLVSFARKFGIDRVVLESHPAAYSQPSFCEALGGNPPAELALEREVPIEANRDSLRGRIRIYRVPGAMAHPEDLLVLPSTIVKGGVVIDLPPAQAP
jgi:hypothetical protein